MTYFFRYVLFYSIFLLLGVKMKNFQELIVGLKSHLADGRDRKVLDKELAGALEITPAKFATIKKRNSIPYENIIKFCKKENLCSNEVFFD